MRTILNRQSNFNYAGDGSRPTMAARTLFEDMEADNKAGGRYILEELRQKENETTATL